MRSSPVDIEIARPLAPHGGHGKWWTVLKSIIFQRPWDSFRFPWLRRVGRPTRPEGFWAVRRCSRTPPCGAAPGLCSGRWGSRRCVRRPVCRRDRTEPAGGRTRWSRAGTGPRGRRSTCSLEERRPAGCLLGTFLTLLNMRGRHGTFLCLFHKTLFFLYVKSLKDV